MHETPEDLAELQAFLDASYAAAGPHLLSIHTPDRRLTAEQVVHALQGMVLLSLATVTASCEPRVGPVDAFFYRGLFFFGSGENSARFRHLRARPACSAVHLRGEDLAITVHGRAAIISIGDPEHAGLLQTIRDHYGPGYDEWYPTPPPYARIDAGRIYTFAMDPSKW